MSTAKEIADRWRPLIRKEKLALVERNELRAHAAKDIKALLEIIQNYEEAIVSRGEKLEKVIDSMHSICICDVITDPDCPAHNYVLGLEFDDDSTAD